MVRASETDALAARRRLVQSSRQPAPRAGLIALYFVSKCLGGRMSARSIALLPILFVASVAFAAEEPQWLKDARAREGKPAKVVTVKPKDGFFTAELPAKLIGKVEQEEASYTISLDIGSDSPMTCEVLKDDFDIAETLRVVALDTFPSLEEIQGKIDFKGVEKQDAGVIGSSPFIAIDWLYRANDGKGAKLGALKQIAASKGGRGLYCSHVDLGYTRTFRDVASAFIESVKYTTAEPEPQYVEISTARIGQTPVGVSIVTLTKDEEGDFKLTNSSSLLVPVAMDTLTAQDTYHLQWARADGSMINAIHVVSANGEIDTNLALKAAEGGGWTVEGVFKQKEIKETIATEDAPLTWLDQALARRALFDRKDVVGATRKEPTWIAISPTSFVDSTMTVTSVIDATSLATREEAAGLVIESVIDRATGLPREISMQMGPQTLRMRRVFVQGSF
jgi:hypothetical protein